MVIITFVKIVGESSLSLTKSIHVNALVALNYCVQNVKKNNQKKIKTKSGATLESESMSMTIVWRPEKVGKALSQDHTSETWEKITNSLDFDYSCSEITLSSENIPVLRALHYATHDADEKSVFLEIRDLIEKHEKIILEKSY